MSFRKRNIGVAGPPDQNTSHAKPQPSSRDSPSKTIPGVRPSPLDGRPTTSTGAQSFDELLGGHAGLALGNSLLIEEHGTTDFAGSLLRYYAAEGVVQGHKVHVVGMDEQWARELPGLIGSTGDDGGKGLSPSADKEKMKIAWRYEKLGEFGAGARVPQTYNRNTKPPNQGDLEPVTDAIFCHSFNLTKRLSVPSQFAINFVSISHNSSSSASPYTPVIDALNSALSMSPPQTIHRLVFPTLLSPATYPPHACIPTLVLPFLHSLRALLRTHCSQLTCLLTLPISLYPRTTGLTCWIEQLCDGVLELIPFPHKMSIEPPISGSGKTEEKPQGMVKVHKLPIRSEKGGGGGGGDDLAFSLSQKRFVIRPYSLPPIEGDTEAQKGEAEGGNVRADIEF